MQGGKDATDRVRRGGPVQPGVLCVRPEEKVVPVFQANVRGVAGEVPRNDAALTPVDGKLDMGVWDSQQGSQLAGDFLGEILAGEGSLFLGFEEPSLSFVQGKPVLELSPHGLISLRTQRV